MASSQLGRTFRITFVTERFHPSVDAATITVRHLVDAFTSAGHAVEVVAGAPGAALYRRCRVTRIRPVEGVGPQVRGALLCFRPDLVVVASPGTIGTRALKHANRLGIPTVTVEHRAPARLQVEWWAARVPNRSDVLLCVSDWQRDRIGADGVTAATWRPGVDLTTFTPRARIDHLHAQWTRPRPPGVPLVAVGHAGPLERSEGVRRLADMADVPGVRVVVVGEGRQRSWLGRRLPRVRFLPDLASGELAMVLASLDLLVHPGERLTAAHTLRAAAACGTPAVALRAGAAPEVVGHGETGLLCPADDLAATVTELAVHTSFRQSLGMQAHHRAQQRGWDVAAGELWERYLSPLLPRSRVA